DGIRDRNVTGVQTCALPIHELPRPTGPPQRSTASAHRCEVRAPARRHRHGRKRSVGQSAGSAAHRGAQGRRGVPARRHPRGHRGGRGLSVRVRVLDGELEALTRRLRDELNALGVRIVRSGRRGRLWRSVIDELETAAEMTKGNTGLTLQFCVNYGGRSEIIDAVNEITTEVAAGRLKPGKVTEKTLRSRLYAPGVPAVDLFMRSSGEQRTSNFLLWQSAYAEMFFQNLLWPDVDRRTLWAAIEEYARRD